MFYNGPENENDFAYDIAVDSIGNIYVTGRSYGRLTGQDYATIKYNTNGNVQWESRYNGPGVHNRNDIAYAIALDSEGNAFVTGQSWKEGHGFDYVTIKYDTTNGDELWVARYDGPVNEDDIANSIAVSPDGNVFVTGYSKGLQTGDDYATIKYDTTNGDELWVARYHNYGYDWAYAIDLDLDGNVFVTGASRGRGTDMDYATIKYDTTNGDELWVAIYNGPGYDTANAIAVDLYGNVYVTGWGVGVQYDCLTIKYDSQGSERWRARYNGPSNSHDMGYDIDVDSSGNAYITGRSDKVTAGKLRADYITIKYDTTNGDKLWEARYNGHGNENDMAFAIAIDPYGNVFVTGQSWGDETGNDFATIKYDSINGNEMWLSRHDTSIFAHAHAVDFDHFGNLYVTGWIKRQWPYHYDYTTIKYSHIVDNDVTPPEIIITYIPDTTYSTPNTDGSPGSWDVLIKDDDPGSNATGTFEVRYEDADIVFSGNLIDGLMVNVNLSNLGKSINLGSYTIYVNAENNDEEYPRDEEISSASDSQVINDDDTGEPLITISRGSWNIDKDNFLNWSVTDSNPSLICSVTISGDASFSSTDCTGSFDFNPYGVGKYNISIQADDNDDDRPDDNLTSFGFYSLTVLDEKTRILMSQPYPPLITWDNKKDINTIDNQIVGVSANPMPEGIMGYEYELRTPPTLSFEPSQEISRGYNAEYPEMEVYDGHKMVVDYHGIVHVAWYAEGQSYYTYLSTNWSPIINLPIKYIKETVIDDIGNIHIVGWKYISDDNSDVHYTTSSDGVNWSPAENISNTSNYTPGGIQDIKMVVDSSGKVHVVWTEHEFVYINYKLFYSCFDGIKWSEPEIIGDIGSYGIPDIAVDASGMVHLVWQGLYHLG